MNDQDGKLQTKLNSLFRTLMSDGKVSLYPYQYKVASAIISEQNVLLRAPTGAGKSWAALLPFIFGRLEEQPLFDRVLYALPLRSLAAQLYQTTKKACDRVVGNGRKSLVVSIQTGEQQEDQFFQGDIIFTTIDQLLSSYLMNPVSLSPRLSNINAGALVGSLVVFDEFHLLDPERSMGTAIEMLDRLNGYCQFILMTATLSDNAIGKLHQRFSHTVIIDLLPEEIQFIESQKSTPTVRKWRLAEEELSAQEILDDQQNRKLVIANTVSRAQKVYEELRELCRLTSRKTEICLLHSRFFPGDRSNIERELIVRLGKANKKNSEDFIFVATQVVEAGMDFTVDHLYSELAPINSLIQRAGRCARYGGEGKVTIYPVPSYLPYRKEEMEATAKLLQVKLSNTVFNWEQERNAVNAVLGAREAEIISSYANLYRRRSKVNQALDGELQSACTELIRNVSAVNIILTAEPEQIRFERGSWPETLSVPVSSIRSFLNNKSRDTGREWLIKSPQLDDSSSEEDYAVRYYWREISARELSSAWMLAINPKFAHYSSELGLVLGKPGSDMDVRYRNLEKWSRYRYHVETYLEHVQHVLQQFELEEDNYLCALRVLARQLAVSVDSLENAVKIALILHDTGKLATSWQGKAKNWQEQKTPGEMPGLLLAHTDFDPSTDQGSPRFPSHAVEGAYAVYEYLFSLFSGEEEGIAACILTAIARHHTGHASKLESFVLDNAAADALNSCLDREGLPTVQCLLDKPDEVTRGGEFCREFIYACNDDDSRWLPLYWYIVRRLRLADQAGTAEGGKK